MRAILFVAVAIACGKASGQDYANHVSAGLSHSLVLRSNGTVWSLSNASSPLTAPAEVPSLSNIVAVSAGYQHSAVLKADGTVWTWGLNAYGQLGDGTTVAKSSPVQVLGLSDVVGISAGRFHTLALKSDGTVWAFGYNNMGQLGDGTTSNRSAPVQVSGFIDAVSISAGAEYSVVLLEDGSVWSFGANRAGQLGNGTSVASSVAVQCGGLTSIVQISAGGAHTMALRSDGALFAVGHNAYGQLGDGTKTNRSSAVQVLATISNITEVLAGPNDDALAYTIVKTSDGKLWNIGYNLQGKQVDSTVPVEVVGASGVLAAAGGRAHVIYFRSDGSIYQLGIAANIGGIESSFCATPVEISGLENIVNIGAGGGHSIAIDKYGKAFSFGRNNAGQLGDGTLAPRSTAMEIQGVNDAVTADGGMLTSTILVADGTVLGCGSNANGMLGDGTNISRLTPVLAGLSGIAQLDSAAHTVAKKTDNTVWVYGLNAEAQLGDGTIMWKSVPFQMAATGNVKFVAAGDWHTLMVRQDGTVWGVGGNSSGQLGNGSYLRRWAPAQASGLQDVIAVSGGASHSLALKNDGTVWAFGANSSGQLGDGSFVMKNTAVQVAGISNAIGIAAAGACSYVVKSDGSVWAFGSNSYGQLGDGTTTSRNVPVQVQGANGVQKIATGGNHALALKEDGTVMGWGLRVDGQLGEVLATAGGEPRLLRGLNVFFAPPEVAITAPGSQSVVPMGSTVSIDAQIASPSAAIVKFYHRDIELAVDQSPPYELAFHPKTWGTFEISAVAIEASGACSSRSNKIMVTVPYDSESPSGDGLPDWWEIRHFGNLNKTFSGDDDNDGLTNAQEFEHATNPNHADTDGDSIPDIVEVGVELNPNNSDDALQDLDGDGFSNLEAYVRNWPIDAALSRDFDDDGDYILDIVESHWIEVHPMLKVAGSDFDNIDPIADSDGDGVLNYEELEFYLNPALPSSSGGLPDWQAFSAAFEIEFGYLPLHGLIGDVDGDLLPDSWEYKNRLVLRDDNTPFEDPDGDTLLNEQEFEAGTDPWLADTDKDGLPDDWEYAYGLNPNDKSDRDMDLDLDGVSNFQEYTNNTNPNSASDSDADGIPDDWETMQSGKIAVWPPLLRASLLRQQTEQEQIVISNGTNNIVNYSVTLHGNGTPAYAIHDSITGGAQYQWEDIGTTGTLLSTISGADDSSESVDLVEFEFPFFGVRYKTFFVSSNGLITLGGSDSSYDNASLPSLDAPHALIAAMWDDLDPSAGGEVYFEELESRVIIQFENIKRRGTSDVCTFQVVLNEGGKIELRYRDFTALPTSCTVGIQDHSQTHANLVVHNAPYLQNAMTLVLEPNPEQVLPGTEFFKLLPLSGMLAPGGSATLTGSFSSGSLGSGTYTSSISVATDDPSQAVITTATHLDVSDHATTVSMSSPTHEMDYVHGNAILLAASALNPEFSIQSVAFYANGEKLAEGYQVGANQYQYSWYPTETGVYVLTAVATTPNGAEAVSTPIDITVVADTDGDGMPDAWEILYGLNPDLWDDYLDTDSDGIPNFIEYRLGFDPQNVDSDSDGIVDLLEDRDGDGLRDLWEFMWTGDAQLAEASSDEDGDGLSNLEEQNAGTQPEYDDTDFDGLKDGWEVAVGLDPLEAEDGSSVDSDGDGLSNGLEFELGLDPLSVDSDSDGVHDASEDVDSDGLFDSWEYRYFGSKTLPGPFDDGDLDLLNNLQEQTAGTDPGNRDSDYDQLSDAWEIANGLNPRNGSDGYDWDSDGDGLTNLLEQALGFNPLSQDTDGDSIFDKNEDRDVDGLFDWWEMIHFDSPTLAGASGDPDGDSLTNLQEQSHGTYPLIADSDNDSMPDDWELMFGLDPLDASDGYSGDADNDGVSNINEYKLGFAPNDPDSDNDGVSDSQEDRDGDGLLDLWELENYSHPTAGLAAADDDGDGLSNLQEQQAHTSPHTADSDWDSLPDGWEHLNGLDPNSSSDWNLDLDGDGIANSAEYKMGLDPQNGDSDNDGTDDSQEDLDGDLLSDWWEVQYFGQASSCQPSEDSDNDGLTNLIEWQLTLNPKLRDTDDDLLVDGWEVLYGLDPKSDLGQHGAEGDSDNDGLTNFEEQLNESDPTESDSDGDGTDDRNEVNQASDPKNASDGGQVPQGEVEELLFSVGGDYTAWTMKIVALGPQDTRAFSVVSPKPNQWKEERIRLQKGNKYEITLIRPQPRPQDSPPWYCWEATVGGQPHGYDEEVFVISDHWLVDNRQGLLALHTHSQGVNKVSGKKATLIPIDIAVYEKGTSSAPADGLVVKRNTEVVFEGKGLPTGPEAFADGDLIWKTAKLKHDGKWTEYSKATKGSKVDYSCKESGIFRVKLRIKDKCEFELKRKREDRGPHPETGIMTDWGPGRKGQPDAFGVAFWEPQIGVRNAAKNYIATTSYNSLNGVPAAYGFPAVPYGSPLCNIFVAHRAVEGGVSVPKINGRVLPGVAGYLFRPPVANQWAGIADTDHTTVGIQKELLGWSDPDLTGDPEPGYIIADPNPGGTGHVGIIDYDGQGISASSGNFVTRNMNTTNEFAYRYPLY